ncbi:MAG: DUF2333 family protein [Alphaproteobacteria bacterium]|nr:DUF2333 family protein [Alphaproteobacteria bacterium]
MFKKIQNKIVDTFPKTIHVLSDLYNKILPIIKQTQIKKSLIIFFIALLILYYPIGALLTHNIVIDKSYEPQVTKPASATIASISKLLFQEVYNNTWTPSLPFIFPAYILDNMPSFQQGVLNSTQKTTSILSIYQKLPSKDSSPLQTAAELLKYPSNIWMFSASNQLIPAPSSNSQYRRARKHLEKYNRLLSENRYEFIPTPEALQQLFKTIATHLYTVSLSLEDHIRENNGLIDFRSDNIFYQTQGLLYGYYTILKGINIDYKNIIIDYNLYTPITIVQKALENGISLSPLIIKNSSPQTSIGANHLFSIGFYTLKASYLLQQISSKLPSHQPQGNKI